MLGLKASSESAGGTRGHVSERERALLARIAELERALQQARADANGDRLTGALNRRGWEHLLASEEERCRRHELDAVIVTADLNDLKARNDEAGHAAGDQLLIACVQALKSTTRAEDTVARTGGDEFAVLAVQAAAHPAAAVASRAARALDAAGVRATLGAGSRSEAGTLQEAWQHADRQMVAAKPARRDRR
jgi:diguanylate cyclase